jgi:two-component system, NtrC family, C4-dicarboxylate transport response regulator DctD
MISNSIRVLVVEDDPAVLLGTQQALQLADFDVEPFADAESALTSVVPDVPAIIICDVKLPGLDGLGLLAKAQSIDRDLAVILITGHGDVAMAVNAMRLGAYDFVEKPFPPGRLVEMARRAAENRRLILQVRALRAQLADQCGLESSILGSSPGIRRVRQFVLDLAGPPANVLIQGETGTGKELVARSMHQHSPRSSKPFVAINCGCVPEQLFESEMFGYEPGAFTDASHRRIGKIQHASGGTLFLDEIESMPAALQVKLLRVLQEQKVERLGSNELIPVDVRIIAASKANLKELAESGHFRGDLLYRLNVAVVDIPPLRDRMEDIPLLFEHFVVDAARRHNRPMPVITVPQLKELMSHDWPGNVRELRNVADRFVLGLLDDSVSVLPGWRLQKVSLGDQINRFERVLIEGALAEHHGNASLVCRSLGIPKRTLYDKMRKLGLSTEEFQASDAREAIVNAAAKPVGGRAR